MISGGGSKGVLVCISGAVCSEAEYMGLQKRGEQQINPIEIYQAATLKRDLT